MKRCLQSLLFAGAACVGPAALAYEPPQFPFTPAAGEEGSVAVWNADPAFLGWATGIQMQYGDEVGEEWKTPDAALGPASLNNHDVVVLGRGGSATLEFQPAIRNGGGFDFAVFENSFSGTFLELAWVEVSSDGEHFVRFPNYSLTANPVGGFGDVQPEFIEGFGGKHAGGYGTPFDLGELEQAHAALLQGYDRFSEAYASDLLANFPLLDMDNIRFVRIVDIPGDGTRLDCEGFPIYDPYPTIITAGFDLDAVGALNQADIPAVTFATWSGALGLAADPLADGDGDGWSQYLEYLFGSEPRDAGSKPSIQQTIAAGEGYSLLYWRNLTAESVLEIHYSLDGETWLRAESKGTLLRLDTRVSGNQSLGLEQLTLPIEGPVLLLRFSATVP